MTRRCGAARLANARQRRPHLARDAEDENVAGRAVEIGDERRRRLGHEVFERCDALEALGQALRSCGAPAEAAA